MGDAKMLDAMVHDGLTNPFSGKQMFVEATEVGDELEMTRADVDRWALPSHELALKAIDEGRMAEEIVPVIVNGRKQSTVVEIDEGPRRDTSLEALAEIVAHAQSANDFAYLATTPAKKALEKAGLQPGDIDVWEINEAFVSVTLNSIRMLGIDGPSGTSRRRQSAIITDSGTSGDKCLNDVRLDPGGARSY